MKIFLILGYKRLSRQEKIDKIVIVCSTHDFAYPCGICRQVMTEFMDENGIIVVTNDKEIREYKLSDLMPESFRM